MNDVNKGARARMLRGGFVSLLIPTTRFDAVATNRRRLSFRDTFARERRTGRGRDHGIYLAAKEGQHRLTTIAKHAGLSVLRLSRIVGQGEDKARGNA